MELVPQSLLVEQDALVELVPLATLLYEQATLVEEVPQLPLAKQ